MTTTISENTATAEKSAPERPERKEPTYLFTEKYVADKSETARRFIETRARSLEKNLVRPFRRRS